MDRGLPTRIGWGDGGRGATRTLAYRLDNYRETKEKREDFSSVVSSNDYYIIQFSQLQ